MDDKIPKITQQPTVPPQNQTKNNIIIILLYALAISAALGFTDLINTIFDRFKLKGGHEILTKVIYVIVMFLVTLTLAYYTKTSIPL